VRGHTLTCCFVVRLCSRLPYSSTTELAPPSSRFGARSACTGHSQCLLNAQDLDEYAGRSSRLCKDAAAAHVERGAARGRSRREQARASEIGANARLRARCRVVRARSRELRHPVPAEYRASIGARNCLVTLGVEIAIAAIRGTATRSTASVIAHSRAHWYERYARRRAVDISDIGAHRGGICFHSGTLHCSYCSCCGRSLCSKQQIGSRKSGVRSRS
jgi:hypothetical protein